MDYEQIEAQALEIVQQDVPQVTAWKRVWTEAGRREIQRRHNWMWMRAQYPITPLVGVDFVLPAGQRRMILPALFKEEASRQEGLFYLSRDEDELLGIRLVDRAEALARYELDDDDEDPELWTKEHGGFWVDANKATRVGGPYFSSAAFNGSTGDLLGYNNDGGLANFIIANGPAQTTLRNWKMFGFRVGDRVTCQHVDFGALDGETGTVVSITVGGTRMAVSFSVTVPITLGAITGINTPAGAIIRSEPADEPLVEAPSYWVQSEDTPAVRSNELGFYRGFKRPGVAGFSSVPVDAASLGLEAGMRLTVVGAEGFETTGENPVPTVQTIVSISANKILLSPGWTAISGYFAWVSHDGVRLVGEHSDSRRQPWIEVWPLPTRDVPLQIDGYFYLPELGDGTLAGVTDPISETDPLLIRDAIVREGFIALEFWDVATRTAQAMEARLRIALEEDRRKQVPQDMGLRPTTRPDRSGLHRRGRHMGYPFWGKE